MERLISDIRKGTRDSVVRNDREFISFQCLGRTWTETGRFRGMFLNTLDWPVPIYQAEDGTCYVERKHVERIFDLDLIIVNQEGIERPSLLPDGKSDPRYMQSMRLKLTADNLWTLNEKQIRGVQDRRGKEKRIVNPTISLPKDSEEPTLFEVNPDRVNIACDKNKINCLLRYCKHIRPNGTESTSKQRKRLVAREKGTCLHCGEDFVKNDVIEVDHLRGIAKFIDLVLSGKLTVDQAGELWWSDSNLRAVHKGCNQDKSHSTQRRKKENKAKK